MKILILLDNESRTSSVDFVSEIKKIYPDAQVVSCLENDLIDEIRDAEVFASFGFVFSAEILKHAEKLKWLHSFSAGVDRFLIPEVIQSEIILTNSSGVHPIQIGEHVFGMILAFERGIIASDRKRPIWDRNIEANEIFEKKICIVGAGRIGERIAELAKAFGCSVVGVTRSGSDRKHFDSVWTIQGLKGALKDADYVINILPHTVETNVIFNEALFKSMKQSALYINIGRGKTTDESALIQALTEGTIRGACLDVFDKEPLPASSKLWTMNNVVITPHIAGKTPRYLERARNIFLDNLKAYVSGGTMPTLVDKKSGY